MLCECVVGEDGRIRAFCREHQRIREDRLHKLVQSAYWEGAGDGYDDYTNWQVSDSRKALLKIAELELTNES